MPPTGPFSITATLKPGSMERRAMFDYKLDPDRALNALMTILDRKAEKFREELDRRTALLTMGWSSPVIQRPPRIEAGVRIGVFRLSFEGEPRSYVLDLEPYPPIHDLEVAELMANAILSEAEPVESSEEPTFLTHFRPEHLAPTATGSSCEGRRYVKPDFSLHIGVFGSSGTGKSVLLRNVIEYLANRGEKVLALDWVGNLSFPSKGVRILVPGRDVYLNPVEDLGREGAMDLIREAMEATWPLEKGLFSPMVQGKVDEAMKRSQDLRELMKRLEEMGREYREAGLLDERNAVKAALYRLRALNPENYSPGKGKRSLTKILEDKVCVILDLSSMKGRYGRASDFDRLLFGISVMRSLMKFWRPEKGTLYLVIDEAHRYALARAGRREWIIEQLAREARNYGIRLICAAQNPSELSEGLRNNLQVKYVFGLSGQEQIDALWGDLQRLKCRYPDLSPSQLRSEISYVVSRLLAFPGVCLYLRPGRAPVFVKVKYRELREVREEEEPEEVERMREAALSDEKRVEEIARKHGVNPQNLREFLREVSPSEFLEALGSGKKVIRGLRISRDGELTRTARAYAELLGLDDDLGLNS